MNIGSSTTVAGETLDAGSWTEMTFKLRPLRNPPNISLQPVCRGTTILRASRELWSGKVVLHGCLVEADRGQGGGHGTEDCLS